MKVGSETDLNLVDMINGNNVLFEYFQILRRKVVAGKLIPSINSTSENDNSQYFILTYIS